MKTKVLLIFLPVLLLATGCAASSNQATEDLIRACELVNTGDAEDKFIPDVAIEFFASAARANVEYLPLVQAAKLGQLQPFDFAGRMNATTSEVLKARSMIVGYCTPRVAN